MNDPKKIKAALRELGYKSFRPGQEQVVRDLLQGRDVLVVLPTGAGKSLTYQLASQLLPGVTVVVSPLIALMKDQVESLEDRGVDVAVVNSTQSGSESEEEMREVEDDESKLLYVTPERFSNQEFMADLQDLQVSLLVVDEAHSVSEWGHDFRPAYLALGSVAGRLGHPTMLALTATATPWVRREIVDRLEMRDPSIVVRGTYRPNLLLEVQRVEEEAEDRRVLQKLLSGETNEYPDTLATKLQKAMQGSGIVYTTTTKGAEETAGWLQDWGIAADYYHGQRSASDRNRVQEEFMTGKLRVIAATNAFGLGVDKPDVRFVIHRDVPGSVESYYQEAGRAGRDGELARCTLIYRPADLGRAAFLSGGGQLTRDDVCKAHGALQGHSKTTLEDFEQRTRLNKGDLARLITTLERQGILEEDCGNLRLVQADFDPDQVSFDQEEHRRAYERSRLEMMRGYAELSGCRWEYILNYFGEEFEDERCELCDADLLSPLEAGRPNNNPEASEAPFSLGEEVIHEKLGHGVVQRLAENKITVLFDKAGYKTLSTELVLKQELLRRAAS